eukprot:CAMPEP_0203706926 /NCGR_PEP_ID=MMETSP0091-20130426/54580_1 /ASSEMBLY_ACC=CAM_ASM_001089 /TAXON_ID=426623 /ORGANISM="Chaetoceros affinis, Strain CCMP159" /LENGTH=358 /DNA_ID=CAMNT_0050582931 /DNA_START=164 /DNA_END=1240 /DNA_ORIENTATION=-
MYLGYEDNEIIRAGIIPRDMTVYGGYDNIVSMKQAQTMSRTSSNGPFDIIYSGGETLGCRYGPALRMLHSQSLKELAFSQKIFECAYVVPKDLLLPLDDNGDPDKSVNNIAIANSLGGYERGVPECTDAVDLADYISYRDLEPLAPDSIVMVKELYGDVISSTVDEVRMSLFPGDVNKKYIAVEFSFLFGYYEGIEKMAGMLDDIAKNTNCAIVLFASGTAKYHDNINFYHKVADKMTESVFVNEEEHVWKAVATIAGAEAVLGTSVHVQMISFVYQKPRVSWCQLKEVRIFISIWEPPNMRFCSDVENTWKFLRRSWGETPQLTQDDTVTYYNDAKVKYMESFNEWSNLLDGSNTIE